MKKHTKYLIILILLGVNIFVSCQSKQNARFQNLGFEDEVNENGIPSMWELAWEGEMYHIYVDNKIKFKGKKSLKIECKEENGDYQAVLQKIPAVYEGSVISVTASLKLKDIENAAGLMLHIDGGDNPQYEDMFDKDITGTLDWQQYTISLPLPQDAEFIYIGIFLMGKGILWADDVSVLIDGKDYKLAPLKKEKKGKKEYNFEQTDTIEFAESSKINITELNDFQLNNIDLLGKIWGFLKYYHPEISAGKYNWDFELFRILPKILAVDNQQNRDNILKSWIENLGEIKEVETVYTNDSAILKPDFSCINTDNFSVSLVETLNRVENTKRPTKNYYVELVRGVGNPEFKNEKAYNSMIYPDAGYRLLSLFRY
jgi:hypothetical protein